ncbi:MAG: PHP-associated domain-containing protein [Candidatus Woesearchaeota archaeon]
MGDFGYQLRDGKVELYSLEGMCKVDGHVHASDPTYVPHRVPEILGAQESYMSIKKARKTMLERDMDLTPLSNHDSVIRTLEMRRKFGNDTVFVNNERSMGLGYSPGPIIHVGEWGLDYPGDVTTPSSDAEVLELNAHLAEYAKRGVFKYVEECRRVGVEVALNHLFWQGDTHNTLTGKDIDDLVDAFDILELNGDEQHGNFAVLQIAKERNKYLCAGSDAHNPLRVGDQFTAATIPVNNSYEYMRAFKDRDICVGSRFLNPRNVSELADLAINSERRRELEHKIIKREFNGMVRNLQNDSFRGTRDYWMFNWNPRALIAKGLGAGIPIGVGLLPWYDVTIPVAIGVVGLEMLGSFLVSGGIPIVEKITQARRTRKLYKRYQKHMHIKETVEERAQIAEIADKIRQNKKRRDSRLPEMMKHPEGIYKLAYWMIMTAGRVFPAFQSEYSMRSRLDESTTSETDKQNT